ncbi:MAG: hypothetical protein QNJ41_15710 [Xenococcaceae cyanobacterium MO_188.B32]|nr:hypothetical protein [Xenococcaceae cyanobacterium MO_188.B32]
MSWRLKLSDWLSGGLLKKYQREAESTKAKLQKAQINVDNLKKQLQYSKREEEQAKAQLLISQGFQIELGETQLKLKETSNKLLRCQQQLTRQQQEIKQISTKPVSYEDWYQQLQTTVDVLEVKRLPQEDFDSLWGFSIASPKAETKISGGSIIVKGWVLGKKSLATTIRLNHQGKTLVETPVNLPSPGVTQYYPDIAAAGKSGFETSLSVVGIPTKAELEIQVLLENQDIVNLSIIALKR